MKIYTKGGDQGHTSLLGGTRVPKHHFRIDTYGTVDELNSWLGLLRDQEIDDKIKEDLKAIQEKLFTLGAYLATDPEKAVLKSGKERLSIDKIAEGDTEAIEKLIDQMNASLPTMTHFILPGGHPVVSYCHITRTVCRRAERKITALHEIEPMEGQILTYINRLSDYLFVLARKLSSDLGAEEIRWIPEQNR